MINKKIDIYSFFSNEIAQILNLATPDYKKYSEATSQPLSEKVYESFVNDILVFRYSLLYVWTIDYCIKKIAVNPKQLNCAGARAIGQHYGELVNNSPNYSKREAKKDLKSIGKKINKIINHFWNSMLVYKTKQGRVSNFMKWYTKYIILKYKVKLSDKSSRSELSDLVLKEAEPLIVTITENMQKELEKSR